MDLRIEVLTHGTRTDTREGLREYAARRLSLAVKRFSHRIQRVTVRLVDENGPRRGVDSRCSISAELAEGGQLFVEAIAAWPFAAVRLAARRLAEALRRDGGRHAVRRGGPADTSPHSQEGDLRAV
jgi:ribosome-associated translation inhibitor RaiA